MDYSSGTPASSPKARGKYVNITGYSYSVTKVYLSLNECLFVLVADWRPVLGELTGFCDHPFWLANPHKSASDYKDDVNKTLGKQ